MARRYEKKRRAEREAETRQRLVEATVELHGTIGPARTTVSAIAERAGVQRHTVYRHFPDELSLFKACGSHFVSTYPPPDPSAWLNIQDPVERLRTAIRAAYAYYSRHERMMANVLRDAEFVPVGAGFRAGHSRMTEAVVAGWRVPAARKRRLEGSVSLALDFWTWRHLTRVRGLTPAEAVDVAAAGPHCIADALSRRRQASATRARISASERRNRSTAPS
jgi:AcrR family transcriptional regulator